MDHFPLDYTGREESKSRVSALPVLAARRGLCAPPRGTSQGPAASPTALVNSTKKQPLHPQRYTERQREGTRVAGQDEEQLPTVARVAFFFLF